MKFFSQSREDASEIVVDWNLGSRCSLKCPYCHPAFHNGAKPFPDVDRALAFIEVVTSAHQGGNRSIRFSFVGGEPTEWSGLVRICRTIREAHNRTHVMSNGLGDWTQLCETVSSTTLSYHAGTDTAVFRSNALMLRDAGAGLHILCAALPGCLFQAQEIIAWATQEGISASLQPLYRDHTSRRHLLDYSADELAQLFPRSLSGDIVDARDGSSHASPEASIQSASNVFTGWKCAIGQDQYVVDPDGVIWGGWCRVGGPLGTIASGFTAVREPLTCTAARCSNPLDLSVAKWRD